MRQVCLLVERQTEEAIVNTLMTDAAAARSIYLTPIIVHTSLTPTGGFPGRRLLEALRQAAQRSAVTSPTGMPSASWSTITGIPREHPASNYLRRPAISVSRRSSKISKATTPIHDSIPLWFFMRSSRSSSPPSAQEADAAS